MSILGTCCKSYNMQMNGWLQKYLFGGLLIEIVVMLSKVRIDFID